MSIEATILKATKVLYPTGRAFKMPIGGYFEKLHKGLAASEARTYSDALSILNSALPDNSSFTADDATDWERRLGLISNASVPLDNRKLAIKRKMGVSNIAARQSYLFLENQLRAAGFDVYVYENRFLSGGSYITKTAVELVVAANGVIEHGESEHGEYEHGDYNEGIITRIANHIDEASDSSFSEGSNLRSTFFIGSTPIGMFADVDSDRKDEFRQLILRIKPVQMMGYLFINYV